MANQMLIGKGSIINVPDNIMKILIDNLETNSGYNGRWKEIVTNLIDRKTLSHEYQKKLKHYFDTYAGETPDKDADYQFIGGDDMKKWLETDLNTQTSAIYNVKNAKQLAGVGDNAYQKEGGEKDNNSNPTGVAFTKIITKGETNGNMSKMKRIMLNTNVTEEIQKIKKLIDFMDNK